MFRVDPRNKLAVPSTLLRASFFLILVNTSSGKICARAKRNTSKSKRQKYWNQKVVLLEVQLEQCTMTSIPEISARGSLLLCFRYLSPAPYQEGRERIPLRCRPLDHMRHIPFTCKALFPSYPKINVPYLKQESFLFLPYGIDVVPWYGISSHNLFNIACRSQEIFPFTTLFSNGLHHITCADVTALFISTWFQLSTIAESVVAIFDSLNKGVRITDIIVFRSVGQTVVILLS